MSTDTDSLKAHLTPQMTLPPAILNWDSFLRDQGRSPYTIKAFLGDLRLLTGFLPPDRTLGDITTTDLNNFLSWLENGRNVPCSPKSLARRITSIKAFFRWLHQYGVTAIDPAEKIVQKSVISPLPQVLTPEEEAKILEVALSKRKAAKPDARPYTLLTLLLETGIKKGECLTIKQNHIDLENPSGPILFIRYTSPVSRYKERKIPISADWISSYQEYLTQYQPDDRLFPWSPRRLEYLLEDIGEEAGLEKHLSFDMCRWTSALNDFHSNADTDTIDQISL